MNKFFLAIMVALLCAAVSFAQGTKGRMGGTNSPQTSLTPNNSAASKSAKSNAATNRNGSNDSQANTSPNRPSTSPTTLGNSSAKRSQERSTRPSETKTNRTATYAPPSNSSATAKGGSNSKAQKVSPLPSKERGTVNWISLEEALEKNKTEKRKIFVDMYTDWCGWCKHMDSTTFVSAAVANYLNEHYYPVKFNAEQEKDIVFKDKTYKFKKSGVRGYHELAALWLNNRLSFPTVVFLDENQQLIQPVPGYQDAAKMEAIINYFGSDSHKKTPWEAYEKNFSNRK